MADKDGAVIKPSIADNSPEDLMFESNLNCMLANIHINEPVVQKAKKARFSDKLETVHIFIPEEPEDEENNSERTSVPVRIDPIRFYSIQF